MMFVEMVCFQLLTVTSDVRLFYSEYVYIISLLFSFNRKLSCGKFRSQIWVRRIAADADIGELFADRFSRT